MTYVEGKPGAEIRVFGGEYTPRIVVMTGDLVSADLVLAGECSLRVGVNAVKLVAEVLLMADSVSTGIETVAVGPIALRVVAASWTQTSVFQDAGLGKRSCVQIVPLLGSAATIDVPDMRAEFSVVREPAWAHLAGPGRWPFSFLSGLTVVTDSRALQGHAITEVARWADGEFQMFAIGDDDLQPTKDAMRVVPLSTLVAADRSIEALYETPNGCSWWRANGSSPWQHWRGWPKTVGPSSDG